MDKVSMSQLIPFSRHQTKRVIKFLFGHMWRHRLQDFLESTSKAKVDKEKRGEDRNTKIWISWGRKELFWWNKKAFFIVFEGLSFDEK